MSAMRWLERHFYDSGLNINNHVSASGFSQFAHFPLS